MDGVIFDSMPYHAKSWVKAFEEIGIKFSEYKAYLNEGRTGASTIANEFLEQKKEMQPKQKYNNCTNKKSQFESVEILFQCHMHHKYYKNKIVRN